MAFLSWALTFPILGSLQYPKSFLTPSLQVPVALDSYWNHTLTRACVNNRLIGPWMVFSLRSSIKSRLFANSSSLLLGVKEFVLNVGNPIFRGIIVSAS